jgi:hypothetical protein
MSATDNNLEGRRTVSPLSHTERPNTNSPPAYAENVNQEERDVHTPPSFSGSMSSSSIIREDSMTTLSTEDNETYHNLNMTIEETNQNAPIENPNQSNNSNSSIRESPKTVIIENQNETTLPEVNNSYPEYLPANNNPNQVPYIPNKPQIPYTPQRPNYIDVPVPVIDYTSYPPHASKRHSNIQIQYEQEKYSRRKKKERDFKYSINCVQKKKKRIGKPKRKKKNIIHSRVANCDPNVISSRHLESDDVVDTQPRIMHRGLENPEEQIGYTSRGPVPRYNYLPNYYQETDTDGDGEGRENGDGDGDGDDEMLEKGWSRTNIRIIKYYVSFLSYMSLVYHFYFFKLKKIEGYWSWAIIVVSSLSSALSLFQYHKENHILELIVKIAITVFSLIVTLISAWVKKQNYVERIAEIGKYSIKINKLKNTVKSILEEPIDTRMEYRDFQQEHKKNIAEYISNRPLISPYEWKETVYIISKYYPELAAYEFPWNKIEGYGQNFMDTYKKLKYNTCWKKIKNCYFCKSKCLCQKADVDRQEALRIMDRDINFYRGLPKHDLDYNPYHPRDEFIPGTQFRRTSYSDSDISEISVNYEWQPDYYPPYNPHTEIHRESYYPPEPNEEYVR